MQKSLTRQLVLQAPNNKAIELTRKIYIFIFTTLFLDFKVLLCCFYECIYAIEWWSLWGLSDCWSTSCDFRCFIDFIYMTQLSVDVLLDTSFVINAFGLSLNKLLTLLMRGLLLLLHRQRLYWKRSFIKRIFELLYFYEIWLEFFCI